MPEGFSCHLQTPPVVMTHGRRACVFDATGKNISIFSEASLFKRAGHAHSAHRKRIRREGRPCDSSLESLSQRVPRPARAQLVAWSGLDRVFFANSGTEASMAR